MFFCKIKTEHKLQTDFFLFIISLIQFKYTHWQSGFSTLHRNTFISQNKTKQKNDRSDWFTFKKKMHKFSTMFRLQLAFYPPFKQATIQKTYSVCYCQQAILRIIFRYFLSVRIEQKKKHNEIDQIMACALCRGAICIHVLVNII